MKSFSKHSKMIFLFSILQILTLFLVTPLEATPAEIWQEANQSYQQGLTAITYEERKKAFNLALSLYHQVDQTTEGGSSALNQALSETYFQLGEKAWATLYEQRALKKDPLEHNLWFWFCLLTFLICSLAIWFSYRWLRKLAMSCAILVFLGLACLLFLHYFTPLEGILVKSTGFYRAPDEKQPQLTATPLSAGSKVRVLQMTSEKDWLKIEDATGVVGYIPTATLRLI